MEILSGIKRLMKKFSSFLEKNINSVVELLKFQFFTKLVQQPLFIEQRYVSETKFSNLGLFQYKNLKNNDYLSDHGSKIELGRPNYFVYSKVKNCRLVAWWLLSASGTVAIFKNFFHLCFVTLKVSTHALFGAKKFTLKCQEFTWCPRVPGCHCRHALWRCHLS